MVNRNKIHHIKNIKFVNEDMKIEIDGKSYSFSLKNISPLLYKAPSAVRECFEIDTYGYGIHWPLLDEDLSVDGLLGVKHSPPTIHIIQHTS